MSLSKTICFVTSGHLSQNPRLYKEAFTAHEAGYKVKIIAVQMYDWTAQFDQSLLKDHPGIEFYPVSIQQSRIGSRLRRLSVAMRSRAAKFLYSFNQSLKNSENAFHGIVSELKRCARAHAADIYVGHNLPALAAASEGARFHGSAFGFDLEDFHLGEASNQSKERSMWVRQIETFYFKEAAYLTASSPFIAEAYKNAYLGILKPEVILNVFPVRKLKFKDELENQPHSFRKKISLFWFSQMIGPGRGLEDVVAAIREMASADIEIHLVGTHDESAKNRLLSGMSAEQKTKLFFHFQVNPRELIRFASEHDLGLALEHPGTLNHDLCISNKIFMYLSSGLGIIATSTQGQDYIRNDIPGAFRHYSAGKSCELAAILSDLIRHPDQISAMKSAAFQAAQDKYCWELESQKWLRVIRGII